MEITREHFLSIIFFLIFISIGIEANHAVFQKLLLQDCTKLNLLNISQKQNIKELTLSDCKIRILTQNELLGLEELSQLNIISSGLYELQNNTFNNLKQLRNLNLCKNQLNELANWSTEPLAALQSLDLSQNSIELIRNGSFESYINLQILNLNANQLEVLNENTFTKLNYLRELHLAHNKLKAVKEKDFSALETLNLLKLNDNDIKKIEQNSFKLNLNLNNLNLAFNKIQELNFLPITNLRQLNMSHNLIDDLRPLNFEGSFELSNLDMSWNSLKTLTADTHKGLKSLEFLKLSHNKLENLTADCFLTLKSLKHLKLDFNNLKMLPIGIFDAMQLLETIDLSYNSLTVLNAHIFEALPFLTVLEIAANQLTNLDFSRYFSKALQTAQLSLDLSYNNLKESVLNITHLASFKSVDLSQNYWSCDWLIKAMFKIRSTIHFGHDYHINVASIETEIQRVTGVSCYDEHRNRSILLLNLTSIQQPKHVQEHVEPATKTCHCENTYRHLNPSPPPVVWPKLYMDKFDSRSVIIWMLIAIAIAFAALRIGRQFLEKNDRRRRLMRKFLPQQSQNTEMEVLRLEENGSSRNSSSSPCQERENEKKTNKSLR